MNRHRLWSHDYSPLGNHPPGGRYERRLEEQADVNQTMSQEIFMRPTNPVCLENELRSWMFSHKFTAMVVGGELHVARLHRVSSIPVSRQGFLEGMRWLHLPICNHFGGIDPWEVPWDESWQYEDLIDPWYVLLDEVLGGSGSTSTGDEGAEKLATKYVNGSCDHCFTDYEFYVEGNDNGSTLELATYHRLGRCETPDDPIWQCLACPSRNFGTGREEVDPSYGAGRTREKWYEAQSGTINI
ncbi:unnamed protein product [Clonostachys rosea]|uniref:Uncharacterized protein n=1 Tax=Bionectria ochroleuca TaxID=29856 RepID=A0ABY6UXS5_BIOOC|nr:unnamed protein product [Clonostachys rosea]